VSQLSSSTTVSSTPWTRRALSSRKRPKE
jgi:hypothetical protein